MSSAENPPRPCGNCHGTGRVNDVRTASITHRATTVRRECRPCSGTGRIQPPEHAPVEWNEDIPAWMLGEDA